VTQYSNLREKSNEVFTIAIALELIQYIYFGRLCQHEDGNFDHATPSAYSQIIRNRRRHHIFFSHLISMLRKSCNFLGIFLYDNNY
jgi:hypothetical protein